MKNEYLLLHYLRVALLGEVAACGERDQLPVGALHEDDPLLRLLVLVRVRLRGRPRGDARRRPRRHGHAGKLRMEKIKTNCKIPFT